MAASGILQNRSGASQKRFKFQYHIYLWRREPAVTGNAVFWIPWVDDPTKSPLPIEHDYGEHTQRRYDMPDDLHSARDPGGSYSDHEESAALSAWLAPGIRMVEEGEITHTVRRIKEVSRDPNDSRELKDGISFPRRKNLKLFRRASNRELWHWEPAALSQLGRREYHQRKRHD